MPEASPAQLLSAVIEQNVLLQAEHLASYPEVSGRVAKGEMRLHSWIYHFENGSVTAYDPSEQRFAPLAEATRGKFLPPINDSDKA